MLGIMAFAQETVTEAAEQLSGAGDAVLFGMTQGELMVAAGTGMVAGFIANILLGGGGGLIRYLMAGVLGGFVAQAILGYFGIDHLWGAILNFNDGRIDIPAMDSIPFIGAHFDQIVDSTFGAIVVIIVARFLGGGGGD